ncbi:phage major capsid protein [Sphingopyxis indica]|uniref:Phage major capsid protein, HK97 family n=1 Tax=Sphingopyxis indica TaxID=436663 RepID=A0A239JKR5_9SPHN|nr:phage major capsid protein [Sphingopyxis indica]SNT05998.1 phage major capsid protein, HK97 family [Sphingopyxis indica]
MDDFEVKADALEGAFDAVLAAEAVDELKASVAALKAQVERQAVAASRLPLDGAKAADPAAGAFVERYLRRGIDAGIEMKSLSGASGGEGGYAVPREIDGAIAGTLKSLSPIRSIATVVQTGTSGYRKLIATGATAAGWVGETAARPETGTRSFAEIAPPSGELYANPAASQAMLDDAMFNVEDWLTGEIAREFAVAEGAAFVNGDGTNRPKGFLSYAASDEDDAARAFGTLQYVASGASGGFAAVSPQDGLIELVHSLRAPYRQGACWVMNSDTLARIRKFKTSDGAFLWQPGLVEGQAATLLGYPVVEAEDMPAVAADSLAIAFGNFRAGYLIADRGETRILRDPFSNKPFVHFYATKRVGGAIVDSNAIKLMKFAAS